MRTHSGVPWRPHPALRRALPLTTRSELAKPLRSRGAQP